MMPDFIEIFIILTYLSMLIELIIFPVPSVASSYQLIFKKGQISNDFLYTRVLKLKVWQKILVLALPTLISIIAYCTPLILIITSKLSIIIIDKPDNVGLMLIAFFIVLTGRIISIYSTIRIRQNNRQNRYSFELKTGNIFSLTRNPILLGMYLSYIGIMVLLPHYLILLAFVYYFIHMHFRILIEESFLKFKFGDKYVTYQAKTKRYF